MIDVTTVRCCQSEACCSAQEPAVAVVKPKETKWWVHEGSRYQMELLTNQGNGEAVRAYIHDA